MKNVFCRLSSGRLSAKLFWLLVVTGAMFAVLTVLIAHEAYAWTSGSGSGKLCCKAAALGNDLFLDFDDPRSNVTFVTNPPGPSNDPPASASINGTVVGWEVPSGVCDPLTKDCAQLNGVDLHAYDASNPGGGFGDNDKGIFTLTQTAWSPVTFTETSTTASWAFIFVAGQGNNPPPGSVGWTLTPTNRNGNRNIFCNSPFGNLNNCVLNLGIDVTKPYVNNFPDNVVVSFTATKAGAGFSNLDLLFQPEHGGFFDGSPVTGKISNTNITSHVEGSAAPTLFVDIQPGTCNNSLNVSNTSTTSGFPVAFLGSSEVDATQIAAAAGSRDIFVNGTPVLLGTPAPNSVDAGTPGQCDGTIDGKLDLLVSFNRSEFIQAVAPGGVCANGATIVTFTVNLAGHSVSGTDIVTLQNCSN